MIGSIPTTSFDSEGYRQITKARDDWLRSHYPVVAAACAPKTVIEYGCGVGLFTETLLELGLDVLGVDLRQNNIDEARRRHKAVPFEVLDLDDCSDVAFKALPRADLGFAFGILYHLENPLGTIRRICNRTASALLIETRTASAPDNALYLHRELEGDEHNATRLTAVPTLTALLTMLTEAGFIGIYRPLRQPEHPQWSPDSGNGRRHNLVAFRSPVEAKGWERMSNPAPVSKWAPLESADSGWSSDDGKSQSAVASSRSGRFRIFHPPI
jgi:SAM-dependent methyltransferase